MAVEVFPVVVKHSLNVPSKNGLPVPQLIATDTDGRVLRRANSGRYEPLLEINRDLEIGGGSVDPLGRVMEVLRRWEYDPSGKIYRKGEYSIYGQSGKKSLWIPDFPYSGRTWPSPSGDYVVVSYDRLSPPPPPPHFMNSKGVVNSWATEIGQTMWPQGHHVADIVFSPSGDRALIVSHLGRSFSTFLFDRSGTMLWQIPGQSQASFPAARDSVMLLQPRGLRHYSGDGNLVAEVPSNLDVLGAQLRASQDGSKAVVLARGEDRAERLTFFDVANGGVLAVRLLGDLVPEGGKTALGMGVEAAPDLSRVAVAFLDLDSGGGILGARVAILDGSGQLLDVLNLGNVEFQPGRKNGGLLSVSPDGRLVSVPLRNALLTYEIAR
ncbi:MAG: hypothetical protein HY928_02795 [Elusimicrobia bacterium]|nr:hypothetical protein [Elusimicrobiota bacterium]